MIKTRSFFAVLLAATLLTGCKEKSDAVKEIKTEAITFKQEAQGYLTRSTGDTIKHLQLEIADDDYQRETGLMYRDVLEDEQGMLFMFEREEPRGFYMKNTNIALDLIFLDSAYKVVSIYKNTAPYSLETIPSEVPAQYVLEINAGLSDEWGISVGDNLILNQD